ncbi:DNA-binding protein RFX7 isoform X1, partial [Tachysurus ichikawai]
MADEQQHTGQQLPAGLQGAESSALQLKISSSI